MATDLKPELKGPLPEDFPGYRALEAEGITSYGKLRKVEDLTTIPGIGAVTAGEIKAILEGSSESPDEMAKDAGSANGAPAAAPAGATSFEAPAAPIKVVCPECGMGGEIASEALLGSATCGNPKHPTTLLVRAT